MSMFGNTSSGAQSNNATTSSAPATGGLFGSTAPTFSFAPLGGNNNTSNTAASSSGTAGGLFGNPGKPADQKPLFGAATGPSTLGSTTAPGGTPSGLFSGGSQTSAPSIFGNAAKPAQATSLFSNPASAPASSAANPPSTSMTTGAFPSSGMFGAKSNSSLTPVTSSATASQPSGLFSSNTGSSNIFGGTSLGNAQASSASAAPSLLTPAKPSAVSSLNSTTPAGAPPKPATSLFGNTGTQGPSLFASAQQGDRKSTQPVSMFSNPASSSQTSAATSQPASSTPAATSLFAGAGQASNQTPSMFGTKPAQSSPAPGGLFGAKPAAAQGSGAAGGTPSSLFGQQASKPAETSSAKPANPLFGGASATPTSSTTPSSLFSGLNNASSTPAGASTAATPATAQASSLFSGLSKPSGTPATAEPAKTQTSSLFSGLGKPASSTATPEPAKPASNLFGGAIAPQVGPPAGTTPSAGATSSATAPALGSTTTTTTTPALSAASMFGGPKAATSAEAAPTQPVAGSNSTLGASTAGPTSSMARLKNKTMDEIITRWATDLSKYQKEFKDQATQVAQWDRLLVENGERIQKLYLETFEAEKGSREIERQLVGIESQQGELESWLDKYEGEVDTMFAKHLGGYGEQLTGPDQERERTYKLAEKVTERLDDMGRDLTKMIKEINDISGTLSKGNKADDPLSQIVRVLNGHLAQLQWIDTNAATLRAKVNAAQKERSTVGSHYGGPEQDNVDNFYRSYMGRR
ncbi:Nsp1-like C-terminal region-domain-containing protein [Hypoxylon crocopeplum]|nr:Nsp1-like C-terminal region-domain-containing protein [Hypoxylon crocopeplum]